MKSVLIDTNLLLLLVIGSIDRRRLDDKNVKCVKEFDSESFGILIEILRGFRKHVSLPNVLSEASNLLVHRGNEVILGASVQLARYIDHLDEIYEPSSVMVRTREFYNFGLSDAAIVKIGRDGVTIVTEDASLYAYLSNIGVNAINLSHYRTPFD